MCDGDGWRFAACVGVFWGSEHCGGFVCVIDIPMLIATC